MPATAIQRGDVRRTIVLFVGDLSTSSESIPAIRAGLKRFVEEQVHPGDLVAVVRSSAGLGALQDFTTDRGMLLAAIDHVRFTANAVGTGAASAYEPIGQPGLQGISAPDLAQADKIDSIDRATLETTATLLQLVHRMAGLPGRKSVVLVSDGLRLTSPDELNPSTGQKEPGTGSFLSPIYQSMRRVVDESVRAGVVLYAIDTRGTSSLNLQASDRLQLATGAAGRGAVNGSANGINPWAAAQPRRDEYSDNQWGGVFLTSQTGGFMITESNRIDAALDRVMADQRGYYLLAFQPSAEAMQPGATGKPDYHRLKIEVLRAGLNVRSHNGFFGVADEDKTSAGGPLAKLSAAIGSPFPASELKLDVDAGYLAGKNDYFIRATVFIDGKDIDFSGPPIHRTGVLRMVVRAFDANGEALQGGIDQTRRIDVDEDGYRRSRDYGLIYTALLTVPKPGAYRVRVACLDETTGKIGTGGYFISIPPANSGGLHLSGIVFQHDLGQDDHVTPASAPSAYSAGQAARFSFQIVPGGGKPKAGQLEMRTRLFRDGVEVWQSGLTPVQMGGNNLVGGSLEVPNGLGPGEYLLRLDVNGKDAPDSSAAWQWAVLRLR